VRKLRTATQIFKTLIESFLYEGMTAVDCTVGNGHDTLFLAQRAGVSGQVYGFDVQASALSSTKEKIDSEENCAPVKLFLKGHEHLTKTLQSEFNGLNDDASSGLSVDIVVYNLGYLPRHDKTITTMTTTTLESVKQAMEIIKPGGVVSIICYPGHDEGSKELDMLSVFLRSVDQSKFDILKSEFINQSNRPPILFLIEKR